MNAMKYALHFFSGETCTFYLLSIYKTGAYTSEKLWRASQEASIYDTIIQESKEKLLHLIEELKTSFPSEKYTFKAVTGYDSFTHAINRVIQNKDIDLIIMGTAGAKGALESIFGQHTLRVIREVNSLLLVIPKDCQYQGMDHLLLTLDNTVRVDLDSLLPLLRLIDHRTFSLDVLRMIHEKPSTEISPGEEKELEEIFSGHKIRYHKLIDVQLYDAVKTMIQVKKINMHVLPVKKEDFLDRLFGSPLSKTIYSSRIPMFIIHE